MMFRDKINLDWIPKINWDRIANWAGRWVLPVAFYGTGMGFLFPMARDNVKVGWMSVSGEDTRVASEETIFDQTTCQTAVMANGDIVDTCQDVSWTQDVNIFDVDSFGLSELLLPVRLIVGLFALAIAYKLTPKPQ